MAITVAQVEAILKVQTQGFDTVVQSIKGLSDNFDKATNTMLAAINKVEQNYGKIGNAAKKAAKDAAKAADDNVASLLRQNKVIFDSGEAFATFAAKATASVKQPTEAISMLEGALKQVSEAMNAGIMEEKQFVLSKQGWTGALNEANRKLVEQIALEKELAAQQKAEAQAIALKTKEQDAYNAMIAQAKAKQAGQNFTQSFNQRVGIGASTNSAKDSMNSVFAPLQDMQQMINAESFKQGFNNAIGNYTNLGKAVNSAKSSMTAFLAVEMGAENAAKLVAQSTLAAQSAMDRQANTILRAKNQYDNLIHSIQQAVSDEKIQIGYINQATEAYDKLVAVLGKPMKTSDVTNQVLQFQGVVNQIKRDSGITNSLQQGLSDVGKVATLAVGPLSGVAARLTAFAYLADQMGAKTAALAAGGTVLAVGWGMAAKQAAEFQMGLLKVSAAAEMNDSDTKKLGTSMIALSKQLMVPNEELLKIAQSAAQAGVTGTDNLTTFTKVVAQLTRTTSLTADTAADDLLALANVTKFPIAKMSELGDMVTKVGQSSLGSESKVLGLATELAKAGYQYGFTTKEAIAWAGALADTGQEAESSSTALVSAMNKIANVISTGGEKMHEFAQFIGMTDEQLTKTFKENGPEVLKAFLEQVAKAPDAISKLTDFNDIDIKNVRMTRSLSALSTYFQDIAKHEKEVDDSTGELQNKFDKLSASLLRQFEGVKVNIQAIGVSLGDSILNPLTNVLGAFKVLTSYTNTWTVAIEALTAVALNFGILWTTGKLANSFSGAFAAGKKAMEEFKVAIGSTTAELPLFAAAEESATLSTKAFTAAQALLEISLKGLMALLRTFWPLLVFEGITWIIDRIGALAAAQKELAEQTNDATNAYRTQIATMAKAGDFAGLEAAKSQNTAETLSTQKDLNDLIKKKVDMQSSAPGVKHVMDTLAEDPEYQKLESKLMALKTVAKDYDEQIKGIVTDTASNTFDTMGKADTRAVKSMQTLITTVQNKVSELDTLQTKGVDAFDAKKIADSMSKQIDQGLQAAGNAPGGAKAYWTAQMKAISDSMEGMSDAVKAKVTPAFVQFKDAVTDSLSGKAGADPKTALKNVVGVLIDIGSSSEVAAAKLKHSMGTITTDAQRAENAIVRTFHESQAQLVALDKVLGASNEGSFNTNQDSIPGARAVANLKLELQKMAADTKGFGSKDLMDLSKELGISVKDLDGMALALYNTDTAAKAAADGIRDINQAMHERRQIEEELKKTDDKLNFDKSILGMSDYDKQIATAGFNSKEKMTSHNDKQDALIQSYQQMMVMNDLSTNPNYKLDDEYRNTIDWLQKQKFSLDEVNKAAQAAGMSTKDFLDKSIETQRLTAQIDTLRDAFQQFGQDVLVNFDNIGSAFASLLKKMAATILENQVFGPMSDMLFGKKGGVGGGVFGDMLSSIFGGGASPIAPDSSGLVDTLFSAAKLGLGGFANGGDVMGNKPIIVGERGPEIFVPSSNGSIINNNDAFGGASMGMSPTSSGSGDSKIHIVIEASSEFDAKIVGVSNSVANNVVMSYDKKKLPARVNQITSDPRAK